MRARHEWQTFDLLNVQNAQIGELMMKSEQWVIVGRQILGWVLLCHRRVCHPADRRSIDIAALGGKPDAASGKHIDDNHHPKRLQHSRFFLKKSTDHRHSLA